MIEHPSCLCIAEDVGIFLFVLFCLVSGSCRAVVSEHKNSSSNSSSSNSKKVEVIDLTLDSSSDDDNDEEPPPKRACPSLSPVSPPINKGSVSITIHKTLKIKSFEVFRNCFTIFLEVLYLSLYSQDSIDRLMLLHFVKFNAILSVVTTQGVESSSGITSDTGSQHASSGDELHPPSPSSHSGLPPLLSHTQWPVRCVPQLPAEHRMFIGTFVLSFHGLTIFILNCCWSFAHIKQIAQSGS